MYQGDMASSFAISVYSQVKAGTPAATTHLDFTTPLHVGELHDDDVSRRARHKQRLIRTVENDILNAELRIITQRVIAANLKCTVAT